MASSYTYRPLDLEAGEIRLLTLYPGNFDDSLRVSFSHTLLPLHIDRPTKVDRVTSLQNTLPLGWRAAETVDGRILFCRGLEQSSWTHPDVEYNYIEPTRPTIESERPAFEALSYCWGPEEPAELLGVIPDPALAGPPGDADEPFPTSGQESPLYRYGNIVIRPNLASALRHLRDTRTPRKLWIDALCINQADLIELGRHVARMGSIFELATRVVVWLGPESPTSPLALETLELLGQQIELLDSVTVPAPDSLHPEWMQQLPIDAVALTAAKDLLARPWFHRLWIWQEIVLGGLHARVQCGTKSVRWYHVRRGLVLLRETNLPDARMRQGLMSHPLLFLPYCTLESAKAWNGIERLIRFTCESGCTDPRDRIYSLLGLCDERVARRVQPDYTLSAETIYRNFSIAFMEEYGSLLLLRFCDLASRGIGSPTWVPDFANVIGRPTQLTFASGNTRSDATLLGTGILGVTGVRAGVVKRVSGCEMHGTPASVACAFRAIKTWYSLCSEEISESSLPEAFFTSIFLGWVQDRRYDKLGVSTKEYHEEYLRLVTGEEPEEGVLGSSQLLHNFMRDDRKASFFCTEEGHVGLGVIGIKPGDIISVLLGCPLTMILRLGSNDTTSSTERFQVVGPAYTHGLNDAQGLLGPIPEPYAVKIYRPGDIWRYINTETSEERLDDPRLPPLPAGWSLLLDGRFQNEEGEVTDEDPRCTTDALRERGVELRQFQLV